MVWYGMVWGTRDSGPLGGLVLLSMGSFRQPAGHTEVGWRSCYAIGHTRNRKMQILNKTIVWWPGVEIAVGCRLKLIRFIKEPTAMILKNEKKADSILHWRDVGVVIHAGGNSSRWGWPIMYFVLFKEPISKILPAALSSLVHLF